MLKKLFVLVAVALVAFAVAQSNAIVEGAKGQGVARSQDNRFGEFDFHVVKAVNAGQVRLEGRLAFASLNNSTTQPQVHIRLGRLEALATHNNLCEFAGAGVMVVRRPGGVHEIRGRVSCVVQDNRDPRSPSNTPDAFKIRFVSPTSTFTYEFSGLVGRGDIQVFRRAP